MISEAPSRQWRPLVKVAKGIGAGTGEPYEEWQNEWYSVRVYRYRRPLFPGAPRKGSARLQIVNADQTARHDWRDFQRIKNDIVGEEWEAVELYPAETRLIDPSNAFYLWAAPKGVFRFGLNDGKPGRKVLAGWQGGAAQRPFAAGDQAAQEATA